MSIKRSLPAFLIMICCLPALKAQFSLNGEFRPRAEYRQGFQTLMAPDDRAAFFISQRTRINMNHGGENFSFGFSLQDIRVWGEVAQLNRSDLNSSVHEAWGEIRATGNLSIIAGRQEIIYDNSRIFGNVDWAQQGRSHDAAILKWSGGNRLSVHAGLAFNQESERVRGTIYNLNNYKTFQYLWVNKQWERLSGSFLFLNNGMQHSATKTTFSQTTGLHTVFGTGKLNLSGSVYLQTGRDAAYRPVVAHYLALQVERPAEGGTTIVAGYELLSGTDQSDMWGPGYTNRSFTPLYGTNHAFNGHMDYFYVGNHINSAGLRDIYGGLTWRPGSWSWGFRIHVFSSDGVIDDPTGWGRTMPKYLGTEADIFLGLSLHENAGLRAGYSQMFASATMEVLKGGSRSETNNWAWLMLILKPGFIYSER